MRLLLFAILSSANAGSYARVDLAEKRSANESQERRCSGLRERNLCLTVFRGNYDFQEADDICREFGGKPLNARNESLLGEIVSILTQDGISHNLVVNARRLAPGGKTKLRNYEARVMYKNYFRWNHRLEVWNNRNRALCEYNDCSHRSSCFTTSNQVYSWFEARELCLKYNADLASDFNRAINSEVLNTYSNYWLLESDLRWAWVDQSGEELETIGAPQWSTGYAEELATECASLQVSRCQNSSCVKWQARRCDMKTELSVVCQFNDSLESGLFLDRRGTENKTIIVTLIVIFLIIIAAVVVPVVAINLRLSRKQKMVVADSTEGQATTFHYAEMNGFRATPRALNYPDVVFPAGESADAPIYETCDPDNPVIYSNSDLEHTYGNVGPGGREAAQSSVYCREARVTNVSPIVLIDNEVYEEKKGSLKDRLSRFARKTFKKSSDSVAAESASSSVYEPLSPVSLGRRSETSSPGCARAYSLEREQLEMDDYTKIIPEGTES